MRRRELLLSLALLATLSSCGEDPDPSRKTAAPQAARRALAGNSSSVDLLLTLADPEQVVAVPEAAFLYSRLVVDPGPYATLPRLASFTAEELLAHRPDLVLVQDWQSAAAIQVLEDAGVRVLRQSTPTTWQDLLAEIDPLAEALGQVPRGVALRSELEARRAALVSGARGLEDVRVLPYGSYGGGGTTSGAGTTHALLIELACLRNAASEAGIEGQAPLDQEQLLTLDPDLLLTGLPADGADGGTLAFLRDQPALADLRALREGHVVRLPQHLYSTASIRLLDAAEALQREARALLGR